MSMDGVSRYVKGSGECGRVGGGIKLKNSLSILTTYSTREKKTIQDTTHATCGITLCTKRGGKKGGGKNKTMKQRTGHNDAQRKNAQQYFQACTAGFARPRTHATDYLGLFATRQRRALRFT